MFDENKFVNSVKLLPLNIKSINPMQNYLHIISSIVIERARAKLTFLSVY